MENAAPMTPDPYESGREEDPPAQPDAVRRRSEAKEVLSRARQRHQDGVAQVYREIPKQVSCGALRGVGSELMERFIDLISGSS
ncbi:hypothetical protein [Rhodococcoides kroppenstedtii]|uniref:hypothetical protein n=1 Tax=Rhodococcoides kroppenstedtii TaxID=293050 RepID=UPI0028E8289A|nr:hypothetical protein [Rhodococcus kroppenstedtii]